MQLWEAIALGRTLLEPEAYVMINPQRPDHGCALGMALAASVPPLRIDFALRIFTILERTTREFVQYHEIVRYQGLKTTAEAEALKQFGIILLEMLTEKFPVLTQTTSLPCGCGLYLPAGYVRTLAHCIAHLFDQHVVRKDWPARAPWTLDQLIVWVMFQEMSHTPPLLTGEVATPALVSEEQEEVYA